MTLLTAYFVNKEKLPVNTDEAFLKLSKGKCLNERPVFDLWLFDNGNVLYKGIDNVDKLGIHKTNVSLDTISRIKYLIDQTNSKDVGDAKGRDNALSIIKNKNKTIVFQSSRIKGHLLELHNLLEYIAAIINEEN